MIFTISYLWEEKRISDKILSTKFIDFQGSPCSCNAKEKEYFEI